MNHKQITNDQLKEAIRIAFNNDRNIYRFYDPNVEIDTLEDIVLDISSKIESHGKCWYMGVYERNKLIGYFVYKETMLISFALAVEYRIRKYLREFFRIIKTEIKGHFMVMLWSVNVRAVKYLLKQGMEVINENDKLIQLAY